MAWSIFKDGGGDAVAVSWAKQLLQMIGAPQSPGNIQFIYDWEKSEGGGGKYNPLNQGPVPGHPELTTTGSQYGGGAADYASWESGLQGAVDYLNMPNYANVLSALKSNNSVGARNALWASPWAASHYGYGSNWNNSSIPGGSQSLSGNIFTSTANTTTVASSDPAFCLWSISFPLSGSTCVLSKTEARALIGGSLIVLGGAVSIFGFAVLTAYGFKKTGALNAVTNAASVIPAMGRPIGAIRRRVSAHREAAKNRTPTTALVTKTP